MPDEEKNEQSLRFGLLSSRLGLALYFLLPNRWCWACLSQEERSRIDAGNEHHNNYRPDYADPNQYQQGLGFDSAESSRRHRDRHRLVNFLDRLQPRSVLEIGPGSGHLTRVVVEHPAVHRYTAVDINNNFLTHLRPRLASLQKPRFNHRISSPHMGYIYGYRRHISVAWRHNWRQGNKAICAILFWMPPGHWSSPRSNCDFHMVCFDICIHIRNGIRCTCSHHYRYERRIFWQKIIRQNHGNISNNNDDDDHDRSGSCRNPF